MANKTIKLMLNAAEFPFTYEQATRATSPNEDAAPRIPRDFFGDKVNTDYGTPQLLYCENVLPFAKGLLSVGYTSKDNAISPVTSACDQCITLRDANENVFAFVPARGANYVYKAATNSWASVDPFTFDRDLITYAYVNGRTFICYEGTKIIEYSAVGNTFTTLALTLPASYTISDIRGIAGASNYLVLFTEFSILWCAPMNLMEFEDIDQGAGEQTPIDIRGQITCVKPVAGGFIVYTARNAIGATFTNDAGSPFLFREISNCGGVASGESVTSDVSEVGHFIWGTNGLQRVSLNSSIADYPAVTDFLVGKQIERWNATTKRVEISDLATHMKVKLAFLAGRYLTISYGESGSEFEFAFIYDMSLDRWGKLRINHVDAFMYPYPSGTGAYTYDTWPGYYSELQGDYATQGTLFLQVLPTKQGIAFLRSTGEMILLNADFSQTSADGVVLIGHIQQRHDAQLTLTDVEIDGLHRAETTAVNAIGSYSGQDKDVTAVGRLNTRDSTENYSRYQFRSTAKNFDVAVEGTFVMSSILATVLRHGYR